MTSKKKFLIDYQAIVANSVLVSAPSKEVAENRFNEGLIELNPINNFFAMSEPEYIVDIHKVYSMSHNWYRVEYGTMVLDNVVVAAESEKEAKKKFDQGELRLDIEHSFLLLSDPLIIEITEIKEEE